jgi:hypothetical protein
MGRNCFESFKNLSLMLWLSDCLSFCLSVCLSLSLSIGLVSLEPECLQEPSL